MNEIPVRLPTDEIEEAERRRQRGNMAELALRHVRMADARMQQDIEDGDGDDASWESRLCLDWIREWRTLTE